jgi:hypothetical protein
MLKTGTAGSIICAVCLLGLCFYSASVGPGQVDSIRRLLANPGLYAGAQLRLPADVTIVEVRPWELLVQQDRAQIAVRVPEYIAQEWSDWRQQLQVGDVISLRATFQPEGYLLLHDMHVHRGRRLKIWVSVLALFLLAAILIHERRSPPRHA